MNIPLSNPSLTYQEKQLVLEVLNTPNLSLGPKLTEFEKCFSDYVECKYAIAVSSGTSGLHLCVKALNIREGDEIITTPFSFIASANCILYERAKPVFVDIDPETLNIDVNKIEGKITVRTKAMLPVHVFGQPCEMGEILAIAQKYDIKIIEDTCEAIGAEFLTKFNVETEKREATSRKLKAPVDESVEEHRSKSALERNILKDRGIRSEEREQWRKVGTFGNCGVFAFYPNKQITTGEGGMIVTNSEEIAKLCRSLRNQGRSENGRWLMHDRLGYNYRISDINCALGIGQLKRIDDILKKRKQVALWYNERLQYISGLKIPYEAPNCSISWFVYVIRLADEFTRSHRDNILNKLLSEGIGCNNYFPPIHLQPFYVKLFGYKKGDFPLTEHISERTIALPLYTQMNENQVDYVCDVLRKILRKIDVRLVSSSG